MRETLVFCIWLFYTARYYDPAIGRFISADSIVPGANPLTLWPGDSVAAGAWRTKGSGPADTQQLNRYSYVGNNPLKYTDPTGHIFNPEEELGGGGGSGCFGCGSKGTGGPPKSPAKPSKPPKPPKPAPTSLATTIANNIPKALAAVEGIIAGVQSAQQGNHVVDVMVDAAIAASASYGGAKLGGLAHQGLKANSLDAFVPTLGGIGAEVFTSVAITGLGNALHGSETSTGDVISSGASITQGSLMNGMLGMDGSSWDGSNSLQFGKGMTNGIIGGASIAGGLVVKWAMDGNHIPE